MNNTSSNGHTLTRFRVDRPPFLDSTINLGARCVESPSTYNNLYRNIEKEYIIMWTYPDAISGWQAPFRELLLVQYLWKDFQLVTSFIETLNNDSLSSGPTLTRFRVDRPPFWDLIQVQDLWKAFKLITSRIETLKKNTLSSGPTLTRFRVDRPPFWE